MALELILTELRPLNLSHYGSFLHYYQLLLQFLKDFFILRSHVGGIMKKRTWLFSIDKINFDNYGHLNSVILSRSPHYRIQSLLTAPTVLWKGCASKLH